MTEPQPLDLAPIQAREQAASPGPWWNDSHEIYAGPTDNTAGSDWVGETCRVNDPVGSDADGEFIAHARQDIPALIAEVLRLRELLDQRTGDIADKALENAALRTQVADLETFANGCDGEGCVLPHSSWCDRAKAQAAENDGCTCPVPWPETPQPHAGYCWLVSPPQDEVEQIRARVAAVLALRVTTEDELEQMDPEQYQHANGRNDALADVRRILATNTRA